jgi:SNF2 family DNA or RNA helicase
MFETDSFFDRTTIEEARKLKNEIFSNEIIFSHGTYQVRTIDPVSKAEYWPFLQLDTEGKIKESFCNCDQKFPCVHLAVSYLVLTKQVQPLHVLFANSFFRKSLFDFFLLSIKEKELFLGFKEESVVFSHFFKLDAMSVQAKKEIEAMLHKEEETEESSLKFSDLSEEEIASYKKGIYPKELKFELSFFSDLAKWLFLKFYLKKSTLHIFYDEDDFPTELRISFEDVELILKLYKPFLKRWLPFLKTIDFPLFIEDEKKNIDTIIFDEKTRSLKIKRLQTQKEDGLFNKQSFYSYWYLKKQGFILKNKAAEVIEVAQLESYFEANLEELKKFLPIFEKNHPLFYDLFFDAQETLHINTYVEEKDDFLKPGSFVFGAWCYIQGKGFYKIATPYFKEMCQTISKKEMATFLVQHRLFFQDIPGFQVHLYQIDAQFSFFVDKQNSLHLELQYSKTQEKGIDLGLFVYLKGLGFFQKKSSPFQLQIKDHLVIRRKDVDAFIEKNSQDLASIEGFINEKSPIEKVGLHLHLNEQEEIEITPTQKLRSSITKEDLIFFKKFVYVKNKGFSSLATSYLPYQKKSVISKEKVPHFLKADIYALFNFIDYLDPRLSKISRFDFVLEDITFTKKWNLELFIIVGDQKINFATIVEKVQKNIPIFFTDNGYLDLTDEQLEWVQDLKGLVVKDHQLTLSTVEFLKFYSYSGLNIESLLNQQHRELIRKILDKCAFVPLDLSGFKSKLRDYQRKGVEWLWFLQNHGLSGLLCDEMGLGKTHQAMALIQALYNQDQRHFLVCCPTSVLYHWQQLLQTFLPHLRVYLYHGQRRDIERFAKDYDVLLTSYGILRRKDSSLYSIEFDLAIFDEVQMAKNFQSQTFLAMLQLKTKMRLGLTGTPIENKLRELKTLFDLVLPGYLPSQPIFQKKFIIPIERHFDEKQTRLLQKLIYPFVLRRKKADVLKDLPPKVEQVRTCHLFPEQKKLYLEISSRYKPQIEKEIEKKTTPFLSIFSLLTKLKMICNHPALYQKDYENYTKYQSGKWDLFCELLHEAMDSEQKVVIFTQYLGMIEIFKHYLKNLKLKYASIQGSTLDRKKELKRFFEDRKCPIFIGSLRAVGLGVDLSVASCVIHYDRWWNPAWENQATDRVHRIGQKRGVQIYKLMTKDSIEESIDQMIARKLKLFDIVEMGKSSDIIKTFTKSDWLELLSSVP